MLKYAHITFQK